MGDAPPKTFAEFWEDRSNLLGSRVSVCELAWNASRAALKTEVLAELRVVQYETTTTSAHRALTKAIARIEKL